MRRNMAQNDQCEKLNKLIYSLSGKNLICKNFFFQISSPMILTSFPKNFYSKYGPIGLKLCVLIQLFTLFQLIYSLYPISQKKFFRKTPDLKIEKKSGVFRPLSTLFYPKYCSNREKKDILIISATRRSF